jgi:hypothetical protein
MDNLLHRATIIGVSRAVPSRLSGRMAEILAPENGNPCHKVNLRDWERFAVKEKPRWRAAGS